MRTIKAVLSALTLATFLTACGETDVDKIADAQACLDKASQSTASSCVAKVNGIYSSGAYLIRCVGKFVEEGLNTPARLKSALQQIDAGDGADNSLAMMSVMAFKADPTPAVNSDNASEAFSYCKQSGSKGLILLSALSKTATTLVAAFPGSFTDPQNITGPELEAAMNQITSNPAAQEAVGSAALSVYQSSCQNGGETTGAFCQQFESAVSQTNGSASAVGAFIANCYVNPMSAGCSGF